MNTRVAWTKHTGTCQFLTRRSSISPLQLSADPISASRVNNIPEKRGNPGFMHRSATLSSCLYSPSLPPKNHKNSHRSQAERLLLDAISLLEAPACTEPGTRQYSPFAVPAFPPSSSHQAHVARWLARSPDGDASLRYRVGVCCGSPCNYGELFLRRSAHGPCRGV